MATVLQRPAERKEYRLSLKALAVALPFLILFWFNLAHHTMFFDEVNAWAISAASPDLKTLFHYVHFEGHPWLWYFILWFPSRLTHDPVGMKWVEAVLGTAIILIIGLLSPFTYKQRALILGSYFLVWEYTVMCRMYSVMLLLVLLYVVRRVRTPEGLVGSCALLGLAGNTDMTGVLLSSALLVEYAYSSFVRVPPGQRKDVVRRWIAGVLVYAALIGLAVITLWPSKDISWQTSGHIGSFLFNRHHFDWAVGDFIAAPWWPISPKFPHRFWETSVKDARWLYLLIPIVLFAYWRTFRGSRNLLLLMGCTLLFGIAFAHVVYYGHVRHWGISFISFVVGLWLQREDQHTRGAAQRGWSLWTYGLLALSAAAGLLAVIGSWLHPFSRARDAAMWIEHTQPRDVVLTGAPDVSLASLAEELQRPVLFLECNCVDTFKLFSKYRENFDESTIPAHVVRAMEVTGHQNFLFSFYRPFRTDEIESFQKVGLRIDPVISFADADMISDNYYLYRITKVSDARASDRTASGGNTPNPALNTR